MSEKSTSSADRFDISSYFTQNVLDLFPKAHVPTSSLEQYYHGEREKKGCGYISPPQSDSKVRNALLNKAKAKINVPYYLLSATFLLSEAYSVAGVMF